MSGASRKVKNPLLSAAGDGFPYENYTESTLLVPVTPATPAVLRDDAEFDSFVGQEPVHFDNSTAPTTVQTGANAELTTIPLHQEAVNSPPEQPAKQGYFTSILSSLPNLSLSSIKGDSSGSHGPPDNTAATHPFVPSYDHGSTLREPPLLTSNSQERRTNFFPTGEVTAGIGSPAQPILPPTAPSTDGPISYRLGNQRRLKYAPPPDLTSNVPKQYPGPAVETFFPPQNVAAPSTILNPYEQQTVSPQSYHPVETSLSSGAQHSDQLSQANSLQGSYRSSPIATGIPYSSSGTPRSVTPQSQTSYYESVPLPGRAGGFTSSSRPIPSRVPEPATPQNTPANVSFPGFELFKAQQDFLATPQSEKGVAIKDSQQSKISRDDSSSSLKVGKETSIPDATFAPISAVKVTEKLEHLLAEQKEHSSNVSSQVPTKVHEVAPAEGRPAQPVDLKSNTSGNTGVKPPNEDSLSDVFLGQATAEPQQSSVVSEGATGAASERTNPSQSHAIGPSVQQYYQPQAQFPPSAANLFAFQEPNKTRDLTSSLPAQTGAHSFQESSKNFVHSPSSFFDSAPTAAPFPPLPPPESNTKPQLDFIPTYSNKDLLENRETPVFGSHPPLSAPQSSWNTSQTFHAEGVASTLNQPPLFYKPAQVDSDLYKFPPGDEPVATSQTQRYFSNLTGPSKPPYDITGGNSAAFIPPSSSMATAVPEPTGSATLNPVQMSVNPLAGRSTTDSNSVPPSFQNLATGSTDKRMQYRAVYHHWFYRKEVEHKVLWLPFSMQDSLRLEEVHNSRDITPETTVATDGGRYDVDILRRQRSPIYWPGASAEVRRCSWFFKGPTESRYVPYDESTAVKLEEEYKQACTTNNWNRRIDLNNGEYIIFHSATVQVHYSQASSPELAASWGNSAGAASRPRVIKRGLDEFHIEDGEPEKVDHLLFLVHGIGSVCDLKFRSVEEVVDEFRGISLQLVQSHYRTASEQRIVNRIEVLPISWHTTLHSEDTGIDKKLEAITLESIPKLRHFANDTLLDILFYTSPTYCQTIMQTVGTELNRLYALFRDRNPDFDGGIYLGGHSLGSLILFDLLCHQTPVPEENSDQENNAADNDENKEKEDAAKGLPPRALKRRLSKKISYVMGAAGTGQPYIHYPQLNFQPCAFFALGSPIGMFVTVRGIDTLGEDFVLPTCPAFFNVFHPFDPVAYRVEALINPEAHKYRPMLIPHHKGRKRMHLELKETMARVGADLKQRLVDSVRSTWNSVYQLALFHKPDNQALEREIDKVVEEQLQKAPTVPDHQNNDDGGADFKVGRLNGGRRIDYVLQEAPFEYINEYIFALTAHVCYWESEDTMLMILKEIYGSSGIQTDAQLPQQTLQIERVPPSPSSILSPSTSSKSDIASSSPVLGMDPTAPISEKPIGPPPKSGFVRKS